MVLAGAVRAEPGDHVVVNSTCRIALRNLGPPEGARELAVEEPVLWEDVGGQEEAKRALREAIA